MPTPEPVHPSAISEDHPNGMGETYPDDRLPEAVIEEAGQKVGKEKRKIAMLVIAVGAFMVLAHLTPLRAWLENTQEWKQYVREFGWISRLGFALMTAAAVSVGVPRVGLCGAAGLLFGFAEGTVISLLGSVLGSYLTFGAIRIGFQKSLAKSIQQRPWIQKMLSKPTLIKVFWVRQLALPGIVLNSMLALSTIRHHAFLGGTFLGYLPLNLAATLGGSSMGKESLLHTAVQLMGALAITNVVAWLVWQRLRHRDRNTGG